tara:strand:+ start:4121 stop:4498 length:378 start_codon:yes stop_codon:yes gene_type:complete
MSDFIKEPKVVTIQGVDVQVFDPPVRKVLRIGPALATILPKLASTEDETEESRTSKFLEIITDDATYEALKVSAGACTDKPPEFFEDMTVSDLMTLLEAAEEVVNWDSLRRLFLKLSSPVTPKAT